MQNVHDRKFLLKLGERVRECRIQKNMTQEDLGHAIGNSGKQIGRVERGEHNVTVCMLYAIANGLQIDIRDLFDFET